MLRKLFVPFLALLLPALPLVAAGLGSPTLTVSNVVAGQSATLAVTGATPNGLVGFAFSLTGPGPSRVPAGPCGFLAVELSLPIYTLPPLTADANGDLKFSALVPPGTTGLKLWLQALDVASCTLTNSVEVKVQ